MYVNPNYFEHLQYLSEWVKSLSRIRLFTTSCTVAYLPRSSLHEILQARVLEWAAMPFSRGSSWLRDWTRVSCSSFMEGRFFVTEPPGKPFLHLVNFSDTSSQSLHANIVCKSQRITWQLYRDKWTLLMNKIKWSSSYVQSQLHLWRKLEKLIQIQSPRKEKDI